MCQMQPVVQNSPIPTSDTPCCGVKVHEACWSDTYRCQLCDKEVSFLPCCQCHEYLGTHMEGYKLFSSEARMLWSWHPRNMLCINVCLCSFCALCVICLSSPVAHQIQGGQETSSIQENKLNGIRNWSKIVRLNREGKVLRKPLSALYYTAGTVVSMDESCFTS